MLSAVSFHVIQRHTHLRWELQFFLVEFNDLITRQRLVSFKWRTMCSLLLIITLPDSTLAHRRLFISLAWRVCTRKNAPGCTTDCHCKCKQMKNVYIFTLVMWQLLLKGYLMHGYRFLSLSADSCGCSRSCSSLIHSYISFFIFISDMSIMISSMMILTCFSNSRFRR